MRKLLFSIVYASTGGTKARITSRSSPYHESFKSYSFAFLIFLLLIPMLSACAPAEARIAVLIDELGDHIWLGIGEFNDPEGQEVFDELVAFGDQAVVHLIATVQDPRNNHQFLNSVLALGAIGDERAIPVILTAL